MDKYGLLSAGIHDLGLEVSRPQTNALQQYVELLIKWNKVYSLTAIISPKDIIILHILDGLSVVPYFANASSILDVGSGMGVPGIILAIMFPQTKIVAIDSNGKKAAFLRQAGIELALTNFKVVNSRVENFITNTKFKIITSRAFADLELFIKSSEGLLADNGKFLAMKSEQGLFELKKLNTWHSTAIKLNIPFLEAQRFLIEMVHK